MLHVTQKVSLRLLAPSGRREGNYSAQSRVETPGDSFVRTGFPGSVSTFKDDHDFQLLMLNPLLQFHHLHVKLLQLYFGDGLLEFLLFIS